MKIDDRRNLRAFADTMNMKIEGPDMGSWQENLPNRSTIENGVADSSKWLKQ